MLDEVYTNTNNILGSNKIDFMNHGYYPPTQNLDKDDLLFSNQITMYLQMFDDIDVKDKVILEIGCGRGGGANSIMKYLKPKKIYASDYNVANIDYCKNYQNKDIVFSQCNAENLPYLDKSFDIVINIESSHLYKNPEKFFNEVHRVLKDDGIFLYADGGDVISSFNKYSYLFDQKNKVDITKNAQESCKRDVIKFKNMIETKKIADMYSIIAERSYNSYLKGQFNYTKYISKKINNTENK